MTTRKTPILNLVGEDGNAFSILSRWGQAARKAGWTAEERAAVVDDATSGDYDHMLAVITANSAPEVVGPMAVLRGWALRLLLLGLAAGLLTALGSVFGVLR